MKFHYHCHQSFYSSTMCKEIGCFNKKKSLSLLKKSFILKWEKARQAFSQNSISKELQKKPDPKLMYLVKCQRYAALTLVSSDLEFEFSRKILKFQHCSLTSNILIQKKKFTGKYFIISYLKL